MAMQYATAQGLTIPTYSSDDSKTPTTPTNPVVTISKDGAALAAAAGTVTVIANYGVHVALTAADMTAAAIAVKITSDNCDPVALSLVTEAGYTVTRAGNLDNLDVAVSSIDPAGTGTETVTVTVVDDSGDVRTGEVVTVVNQDDSSAPLVRTTDEFGQAVFYINDAYEMRAKVPTRVCHSGGSTDFTVNGDTDVIVTVTAVANPAPPAPGDCRLYAWMRYVEGGGVVGAGLGSIDVTDVMARANGEDDYLWSPDADPATTDSSGYAYVDVPQGFQLRVQVSVPNWTKATTLTVPAASTYNLGKLAAFQRIAADVSS